MLKLFCPYEYAESVFAIDYKKLKSKGYKAVIFDIDNTLVHHGDDSTPEIDALFREIQSIGLKTMLLSNNDSERVERFLRNIDSPYVCDADKPKKKGYQKALNFLRVKNKEAVFIGDQIFTDILGANLCGIPNILVKFIRLPDETYFGKRRDAENMILKFYRNSKSLQHRLGDILKEKVN